MLLLASQSTGLQIDSKDFIRKEFLTTDVEKTSERRVSTCLHLQQLEILFCYRNFEAFVTIARWIWRQHEDCTLQMCRNLGKKWANLTKEVWFFFPINEINRFSRANP